MAAQGSSHGELSEGHFFKNSEPSLPSLVVSAASPRPVRHEGPADPPPAPRHDKMDSSGFVGLYNFKQTIGKGHFGTVRLAEHALTKEKVAIKIIDKTKLDADARDTLYNEVRFMKLLRHPHIVGLYEVCETPTQLYLILEYADGGDLFDKITTCGQLAENVSREYFRQILSAVLFCHSLHIAHRDLKPENVLLVDGVVKVSDFGMSSDFSPGMMLETSVGSLAYSAPEILLGDRYFGEGVDVWSLGVTLYILVCGKLPFDDANPSEMVVRIMEGDYTVNEFLSAPLKALLHEMLTVDVEKRIGLTSVAEHPWVTEDGAFPLESVAEEEQLTAAELSQVAATLSTLKIDMELVKRDVANGVDNYNVATYHLLRLQRIRERRESMRRSSTLDALAPPQRGLSKSPSTEDTLSLRNKALTAVADGNQRTLSADGNVHLVNMDVINGMKRGPQQTQNTTPACPESPYQWRFGAKRRPRDSEGSGTMVRADSSEGPDGGSTEDVVARALSRIDLAETQAVPDTSGGAPKYKAPRSHSPLAPLTASIAVPMHDESSQSKPRAVRAYSVPMHLVEPSDTPDPATASPLLSARSEPHRLSVSGRKINLISEESGEDDSPRAVVRSPDRAATNVPMRSSPDFYRGRSQTLGAGPSVGSPKLSPLGNGRSRTMGSPSPSPQPTAMQEEQLSPTKTPGTPRSRRMTMAARGEKKSCTIS